VLALSRVLISNMAEQYCTIMTIIRTKIVLLLYPKYKSGGHIVQKIKDSFTYGYESLNQ